MSEAGAGHPAREDWQATFEQAMAVVREWNAFIEAHKGETTADGHHIGDYKAVLFPSNSNTIEVFRLKVAVAEPAPHLTKLFASNADLLK